MWCGGQYNVTTYGDLWSNRHLRCAMSSTDLNNVNDIQSPALSRTIWTDRKQINLFKNYLYKRFVSNKLQAAATDCWILVKLMETLFTWCLKFVDFSK